jgi:hypothetical protein
MKTNAGLASGVLLAAASLVLGQAGPSRAKKADPDMVTGPLLRMNLLERREGPLAAPKRDPFIPGTSVTDADEAGRSGIKIPFSGGAAPGMKPGGAPEDAEAPAANIRYVGYVQGRETFFALVLFNGQAAAVAAGETLANGWTVVKTGAAEVEVQGPDGSTMTFALEGERK